ncbi:MAG TPA: hypothetical protein PKD17_11025 [Cellvibrionaceae bacterium]|nr:hypothetical protein [Cellvibrionaceae bacterium]HNG60411.1 hypothetical protein [Cellvibrionaceae bacterium]
MSFIRKFSFFWLVTSLLLGCAIAKEPAPSDFAIYWANFHKAFIDKDFKKIQDLSVTSILLRGAVDGIKPKKLSAQDFDKTFSAILATEVSEYQGEKRVVQSTYEKIKSISTPKIEQDPARQRVEGFVFKKENGQWKLAEIYWDELE